MPVKPKPELLTLFKKAQSLQARIGVIFPYPTGVGLIFLINIENNHAVHELTVEGLDWDCILFCLFKSSRVSKVGDATTGED